MNQLDNKMKDFLEMGEATLKNVNKAVNFMKWMFGTILVIVLGFTMDTRIQVEKKADAKEYVSNKVALSVQQQNVDNLNKIVGILTNNKEEIAVIEQFNTRYIEYIKLLYSN